MARRILLTIEYDGTAYSGWQRQYNGLAVQQLFAEALTRATSETITITGASRTDAGVHALGQCAHFDTSSRIPPEKYPFVLNTMLPRDIRVQAGREVPDGFHARFMTCGKRYTYRILNSRHGSAIRRNTFAHVPIPLDVDAMRQGFADTARYARFRRVSGVRRHGENDHPNHPHGGDDRAGRRNHPPCRGGCFPI